jgi:hypothetical protein
MSSSTVKTKEKKKLKAKKKVLKKNSKLESKTPPRPLWKTNWNK